MKFLRPRAPRRGVWLRHGDDRPPPLQVAFAGRFWWFPELTVHPRPVQDPHPPLWVAGVADAAIDRAARLGDAWLCGPVQSLTKARACLDVYESGCARAGTRPDWILRRYAWVGADRRQVMEEVLPAYVDGLMEHWRESVEDEAEQALFAIAQIQRYRDLTGCEHVHAAFGAGLPGTGAMASLGTYAEIAEMIQLFGREVIPVFAGQRADSGSPWIGRSSGGGAIEGER